MLRKPNLLFLMSDDHAGYAWSTEGHPFAHTPNLDRLAAGGTRFARHYCNAPVSTPSRQSILTGQYPHRCGVTLLQTALSEERPTMAEQLRNAGYQTAVFGKMHFNRKRYIGQHGFDTCMTDLNLFEVDTHPQSPDARIACQAPWRPFKDPAEVWLNAQKLPYPAFEKDMPNTNTAKLAIEWLKSLAKPPFALWVSFNPPHSPFNFPIEHRDLVDPNSLPLHEIGPEDGPQVPLIFRRLNDDQRRGIAAAYCTSVRFMDALVGLVLDALRQKHLEEDTLVVYCSDHGYCLGQHGRFEKHCGYEPALRTPLIFSLPGRVRRGAVVEDLSEGVDIAPTILDFLEVPRLEIEDGFSMRPHLIEGGKPRRREFIFCELLENEEAYLRTHRYKYIYCSGKRERQDGYQTDAPAPGRYERLYDLKEDPGEFHNVSAAKPEITARLRHELLGVFRSTHPEAEKEPLDIPMEEALDWYLRPRDAQPATG